MAFARRSRFKRFPRRRFGSRLKSDLIPLNFCLEELGFLPQQDQTEMNCEHPGVVSLRLDALLGSLGEPGTDPVSATFANSLKKLSRGLKFRGARFETRWSNSLRQISLIGTFTVIAEIRTAIFVGPSYVPQAGDLVPNSANVHLVPWLFGNREEDFSNVLWRHTDVLNVFNLDAADFDPLGDHLQAVIKVAAISNAMASHRAVQNGGSHRIRTRRNLNEDQALWITFQCAAPNWGLLAGASTPLAFGYSLMGFAAVKNWT